MQAAGKHRTLTDAQIATIFEAAAIPMDGQGRQWAEDLRAIVNLIPAWEQPEIDRLRTAAKNLRRAAKELLAVPRFCEVALQELVRGPKPPRDPAHTGASTEPGREMAWRTARFLWRHAGRRADATYDSQDFPTPIAVYENVYRSVDALAALLSELATNLDHQVARRKARKPKGGRNRQVEKDMVIRRLHKFFWIERLRRSPAISDPFLGFVNAVFRELGWGEDNDRRVQRALASKAFIGP
jgi:hypothetical protein